MSTKTDLKHKIPTDPEEALFVGTIPRPDCRRVLTAEEGEALQARNAAPPRELSLEMQQAIENYKRLLSIPKETP